MKTRLYNNEEFREWIKFLRRTGNLGKWKRNKMAYIGTPMAAKIAHNNASSGGGFVWKDSAEGFLFWAKLYYQFTREFATK